MQNSVSKDSDEASWRKEPVNEEHARVNSLGENKLSSPLHENRHLPRPKFYGTGMSDSHEKVPVQSLHSDLFTTSKDAYKFDYIEKPKRPNQFDMVYKVSEGLHTVQTEPPKKIAEHPPISSNSENAPNPMNVSTVQPKDQHVGTVKWFTWLLHGEGLVRKHIAAEILKKRLEQKKVAKSSQYLDKKLSKAVKYYELNEQSKMFANAVSVPEKKQIENPIVDSLVNVSVERESTGSDALQNNPFETSNPDDDLYTFYHNLWKIQTRGKAPQKPDPEKDSLIHSFSATEARRDHSSFPFNRNKGKQSSRDSTVSDNLENKTFVSENVFSDRSESKEPYLNTREYISEVWRKNREDYSYLGDENPFLQDPPEPGYLIKNFGNRERTNEPKTYNNYGHNHLNRKHNQINTQRNLTTNLMRETPSEQTHLMDNQHLSQHQQKKQSTFSAPILQLRKRFTREDKNYDSYPNSVASYKVNEVEPTLRNQPLNQTEPTIQAYLKNNPWANPTTTNSPFSVNPYYMTQNAPLHRDEPTQDINWTTSKFSESFDDMNRKTQGLPTDPIQNSHYKYHSDGYQYPVDGKFYNYPNPSNYGVQQKDPWKSYQPSFYKSVQDNIENFQDGQRNEYTKYPYNQNNPEYYYGFPEKGEGYNYPFYDRSYPYSGRMFRSPDTNNVDNRFYESPVRRSTYPEHF